MDGESCTGIDGACGKVDEGEGSLMVGTVESKPDRSFSSGILLRLSAETTCAELTSSSGALLASVECETVVRFAVHGSRKVGGNDCLCSSTARRRHLDSIAMTVCYKQSLSIHI